MSAGAFLRTFYELDNGDIAAIRVQPETVAMTIGGVQNAAATGPATVPSSAVVSKGRRSRGINARLVRIVFPTTAPAGYLVNSPIALPWLDPGTFASLTPNATVAYLGASGILVGRTAESVR